MRKTDPPFEAKDYLMTGGKKGGDGGVGGGIRALGKGLERSGAKVR